ncbi:protein EFFECTOR OF TRANSCRIPTION 2-like isoform X2 [Rhododendron vialii]|uniref:protein EFFECTOR OF TRANSCRIPTION 2-like isoform X2 n=1 Tax=Rhododendron vialii TaxID=182163 RepID=UPI00265E2171|nr:protein EFFECTOR OF TRANSCRIPTION 2-like isoform X2 [Rhododendron vialii]
MECQVACLSSDRLKREEGLHPKHDSLFSDWKVLVGPSDWEDHSLGKEGAERYRFDNLPNCSSCPGLYELGRIVVPRAHSGRKNGNLDSHLIDPVYLGQTDNVRTRLQCYGRDGAHLDGLFSEAFSNGYSIVFRWAPMKNKAEAEKTETRLLETYDYAWNKGNNGVRRRGDVLQQLDGSTSSSIVQKVPLSKAKKLSSLDQKKIDVKTDTCKPLSWEDGSRIYTDWGSNDLLPEIFKFGRSQPRLVTPSLGFNDDHSNICGVALGHGSVCTRPPVGGRKRCDEHKGMKINDFASKKLLTEGESLVNSSPNCGITLDNGSVCRKPPVQGRKRCEDHKGRKITGSLSSESVTNGKTQHDVYGPVLEAPKSIKPQSPVYSETSVTNAKLDTICGADLDNGTFCTERPVVGRKRCEEHKWMRANESKLSSVFDSPYGNSTRQSVPYRSVVEEDYSSTCGATLVDGSACRRPPAEGLKRCWQHKGMRGNTGRTHSFTPSYDTGGISSDICGASTLNGSICHRTPASGKMRCWQHKGK